MSLVLYCSVLCTLGLTVFPFWWFTPTQFLLFSTTLLPPSPFHIKAVPSRLVLVFYFIYFKKKHIPRSSLFFYPCDSLCVCFAGPWRRRQLIHQIYSRDLASGDSRLQDTNSACTFSKVPIILFSSPQHSCGALYPLPYIFCREDKKKTDDRKKSRFYTLLSFARLASPLVVET